ncbi:MAG: TatD family hydrolase [Chthoniobacteraceae bacterium]
MKLFDAHNHWHHPKLAPYRSDIEPELRRIGLAAAIVNGTCEADWDDVAALAAKDQRAWPAFGIHPWNVSERSRDWREKLEELLTTHPPSSVGEIGLDRWIEGHDLKDQTAVFTAHLALAVKYDRPATVHCLQAWGALTEIVRHRALPRRGFLLHAYGGSAELAHEFVERGAFFSFSPYFLHERKSAQREVFRMLPLDRLLVETDAPSLWPPEERNPRPLQDADGEPINHPANLDIAYAGLAEVRGCEVAELADAVEKNFIRLFGWGAEK